MPITNLAHVCLHAKDLETTITFYQEALGLKKQFDFLNKDGRRVGIYFRINERNFIEIFEQPALVPGASRLAHFCLEVDDLDAVITRLRDHGAEVSNKTLGADQAYQAWTKDPDGNSFEFHEYTNHSTQLTGKDCVI